MDRYAVIGHPIAHSKSPVIHALFAQQTAQDLSYDAVEVEPDVLPAALTALHAEGYQGLNVTLPHKIAVAKLCEQVSERAQIAGAVNTLIRTETGWRGDNTDGEGLIRDLLDHLHVTIRGQRVLVLGAGGAARGILKPLLDAQPAELTLSNRNPWKPEDLALQFKPYGVIRPITHIALKGDQFDLIINATSAGHGTSALRLPPGLLADGGVCYDLSYGKAFESFAAWACTQGATRVSDGLGMLVGQAAESFAIWRGVKPDTKPVIARLRQTDSRDTLQETHTGSGDIPRTKATHTEIAED